MAIKLKIKKGDRVKVIAGRSKGKVGDVLRVIAAEQRVVVELIGCDTAKILLIDVAGEQLVGHEIEFPRAEPAGREGEAQALLG